MSRTRRTTTRRERVQWTPTSIEDERRAIVEAARAGEVRIVTLAGLVFFSTASGDAWMLDPEDSSALCLARDGRALPARIDETEDSAEIAWNASYAIVGSEFHAVEADGIGHVSTACPAELLKAETEALRQAGSW